MPITAHKGMKICFASDLHDDCGYSRPVNWPDADVLVLAGDTSNNPTATARYINQLLDAELFDHIIVLDGNHEHYSNAETSTTVQQTLDLLGAGINTKRSSFLPLSGPIRIGDLFFVGRNGWYSFDYSGDPITNRSIWKQELNDNRHIGFDAIEQMQPWDHGLADAAILRGEIEHILSGVPDARIVVATHTAPHRDMVSSDPRFLRTNPFFVNQHMAPLIEEFSSNIEIWCHGHTHHRKEKMINGVYVLANPRGYPGENPSWQPIVIDL